MISTSAAIARVYVSIRFLGLASVFTVRNGTLNGTYCAKTIGKPGAMPNRTEITIKYAT
jgi:hypothetical protein